MAWFCYIHHLRPHGRNLPLSGALCVGGLPRARQHRPRFDLCSDPRDQRDLGGSAAYLAALYDGSQAMRWWGASVEWPNRPIASTITLVILAAPIMVRVSLEHGWLIRHRHPTLTKSDPTRPVLQFPVGWGSKPESHSPRSRLDRCFPRWRRSGGPQASIRWPVVVASSNGHSSSQRRFVFSLWAPSINWAVKRTNCGPHKQKYIINCGSNCQRECGVSRTLRSSDPRKLRTCCSKGFGRAQGRILLIRSVDPMYLASTESLLRTKRIDPQKLDKRTREALVKPWDISASRTTAHR